MRLFQPYIDHLDSILSNLNADRPTTTTIESADNVLNGHANRALQKLVPLSELRENGVFFTGSSLAKIVGDFVKKTIDSESIIADPMCGSGDLLLACAAHLEKLMTPKSTLDNWSNKLIGQDLHPEFIAATKRRLVLFAIRQFGPSHRLKLENIEGLFPNIRAQCSVSHTSELTAASHVVFNPPFVKVTARESCNWARGTVNSAAIHLDGLVDALNPNTRIIAILPDVLRSGTRYSVWRDEIESKCVIEDIFLYGRFDHITDVDVFVLSLRKRNSSESNEKQNTPWISVSRSKISVGDFFNVSVGPVVNYRDPKKGPWHPFIQARELGPWDTLRSISIHRRFKGRVIQPPFLAVRRTSRPEDRHRATATIIATKRPVAVENHILVLEPICGTIKKCKEALQVLQDNRTNDWLNVRIRCRHLTTSSVREIPWLIESAA